MRTPRLTPEGVEPEWLFPKSTRWDQPLSMRQADNCWKKGEQATGLWQDRERPPNFGWHGLRVKCATEFLARGYTLSRVNKHVGWKRGSRMALEICERVEDEDLYEMVDDRGELRRAS